MEYTLGLRPDEIILTIVAFVAQNNLFQLVSGSGNTLGMLAMAFGLIGMTSLVLLPQSWNFAVIGSWLFLFFLIVVYPVGEAAFFSKLTSANVEALTQPLSFGNIQFQKDFVKVVCGDGDSGGQASCSNVNLPTGEDVADNWLKKFNLQTPDSSTGSSTKPHSLSDGFYVFTPEAAVIHVLNQLNYGIATQLSGFGGRVIGNNIGLIKSMQRLASADTESAYNISMLLAACGDIKSLNDKGYSYLSSEEFAENHKPEWSQLESSTISAADAVQMFMNYVARYKSLSPDKQAFLMPPLICKPGTATSSGSSLQAVGKSGVTVSNGPSADCSFTPTEQGFTSYNDLITALGPIMASDSSDFARVQKNPTVVLQDLVKQAQKYDISTLQNQPVSVLVPLNLASILINQNGDQVVNVSNDTGVSAVNDSTTKDTHRQAQDFAQKGAAAGVAIGKALAVAAPYAAACVAGAYFAGIGCPVAMAGMYFTGMASAITNSSAGTYLEAGSKNAFRFAAASLVPTSSAASDGQSTVMVVNNCAQLHRVVNLRLDVSANAGIDTKQTLKDILADDRFKSKLVDNPDFQGLTQQEQTTLALSTYAQAEIADCKGDNTCIGKVNENVGKLLRLNRNMVSQASSPMAQAMVESAQDPLFRSNVRNLSKDIGQVAGPWLVRMQSWLGDSFNVGTYVVIAPLIVMYATALAIILTPLIYMLGLLVPVWAPGIIFMPFVVIVYFQLTKIIFTMIGVVSRLFIAMGDANLPGMSTSTADFADIMMASAYIGAFMITGLVLFALKNPVGAIQQLAGGADQLSTISTKEALAAVGPLLAAAKFIPGAGGAMAAAASGAIEGRQEAGESGFRAIAGGIYDATPFGRAGIERDEARFKAKQDTLARKDPLRLAQAEAELAKSNLMAVATAQGVDDKFGRSRQMKPVMDANGKITGEIEVEVKNVGEEAISRTKKDILKKNPGMNDAQAGARARNMFREAVRNKGFSETLGASPTTGYSDEHVENLIKAMNDVLNKEKRK